MATQATAYSLLSLKPFASGAAGKLLLAKTIDERYVALKLLRTHLAQDIEEKALKDYRQVFNHSNSLAQKFLVPILHVEKRRSGRLFYTMPLADDVTNRSTSPPLSDYKPLNLSEHLRRKGPLLIDEALHIADQLLLWKRRRCMFWQGSLN